MSPAPPVIDVQKGIDEVSHWDGTRNNPEAEGKIRLLMGEWRSRHWPVIITQHFYNSENSPFHEWRPGNALKDFIFVSMEMSLSGNQRPMHFLGTPLKEKLDERKVSKVVISGFVTNNAVEATARMCGERGFKTIVVFDAAAAFHKNNGWRCFTFRAYTQHSLIHLEDE